ncbi:RNA polymerase sigma factor [Butyrivibrio proteoclasticus]|uniref:RNA polymerase sigma factor n=1 Tax=Butyrivibrio proteoclasticus TaxID=43305 RepID=UPI00047AD10E|nr:sigma-70 family RNA polymerase sigma factor [Butyrivibrio proteoclasticus]
MEEKSTDIRKIVEAAQNGDVESFGKIYEYYKAKGISIARQYVKTAEDAEDMYQDSFMKAMQHIDAFDISKDFGPWLDVIIVNTCKNFLVKKKPTNFSDVSEEETEFVDTIENKDIEIVPESAYDRKELMKIMGDIIDTLPQAQKEAVVLYYYKELSVKQIAQLQEVPEDTIKSRLNYSRKKVSAAVEDFEKKNGIKIHSIIIVPLLLSLFFKNTSKAAYAESLISVGKEIEHSKGGNESEQVNKNANTDAQKTVGMGKAGKAAAIKPMVFKIVGAIVALLIVLGGTKTIIEKSGHDDSKGALEQNGEEMDSYDPGYTKDIDDIGADVDAKNVDLIGSDNQDEGIAKEQNDINEYEIELNDNDEKAVSAGGMYVGKSAKVDIDGDGKEDEIKVWYEEYESFEQVYQPEYYIEINGDRFDITALYSKAYMGYMNGAYGMVKSFDEDKYSSDYNSCVKAALEEAHCHIEDYHGEDIYGIPKITMLIMDIDKNDGHSDILIPIPNVDNYAGDSSEGFDYTSEDVVYVLNYSEGQLNLVKEAFATGDTYVTACKKDYGRLSEIFVLDGNNIVVKQNEVYGSNGDHEITFGEFFDSDRLEDFIYADGTVKSGIIKVN